MYNNGRSVTILKPEDDFYPLCLIFKQENDNLVVQDGHEFNSDYVKEEE